MYYQEVGQRQRHSEEELHTEGVRVVNAVGGNHRRKKQLCHKLIDHKSTKKAKII